MDKELETQQSEPKSAPASKRKTKRLEGLKEAVGQVLKERTGRFIFSFSAVVVLLAIGFAGYFWHEATVLKKDPQEAAQEETTKLMANVSKLIVLPEGEIPTVATVTDPEALKGQPFFAKAKAGDKVLIYTNAKKAILYDPVADKIIEVAPINIGDTPSATP